MVLSTPEGPVVGIDLGTTFARVGVWQNDRVEIVPSCDGSYSTPSYVAFTETSRLIGHAAKYQLIRNARNTVFGMNQLVGRKFSDPEVQRSMKHWPFKVICGQNDNPEVEVQFRGETKTFQPVEILVMLLAELRELAEKHTGKTVKEAVLTVPSCFNHSQRRAMKDAGEIAGLNVLRFVNPATAASIAYGFGKDWTDGEHDVLVFDLGGGMLDVSVVTIEQGIYEVKAAVTDARLGGQVLDNRLVEHCVTDFERVHDKNLRVNLRAITRLRLACEQAKRALSSSTETYIELDALHDGIDYYATITRAEMENLSADLFDKALQLVQKVLRDARVAKDRVREVVVGGGSARSPKMLQLLKDFFSDKALSSPIRPDEGAAFGVTVQAAILNCVASPTLYDFIMLDVTPLSLWAEVDGTNSLVVIYRHTTVPTKRTVPFSTSEDNQAVMRVRIFEGEHSDMSANCLLGTIEVDNIPLKPRGESEIEVTLDINADDIVNVSVKEISTGLEKNLSIGTDAREELRLGSKTALESYANTVCSSATANIAELKRSIADMQAIKDSATDTLHWLNGNHSAEKEAFDVKRQKLEEVATPATRGSSGDATTAA
ncbi:Heat shock 70 kDa protein [Phytophthora ramorum]|uniref:Heat shock 70 kDa protein n=1 Tax=Phytophthora ramorum TaxID=164328 RepID=UPI0030A67F58|nr:Heat shock 70 kDa protein [Phytophthora ramorum]